MCHIAIAQLSRRWSGNEGVAHFKVRKYLPLKLEHLKSTNMYSAHFMMRLTLPKIHQLLIEWEREEMVNVLSRLFVTHYTALLACSVAFFHIFKFTISWFIESSNCIIYTLLHSLKNYMSVLSIFEWHVEQIK